eukprot:210514_1
MALSAFKVSLSFLIQRFLQSRSSETDYDPEDDKAREAEHDEVSQLLAAQLQFTDDYLEPSLSQINILFSKRGPAGATEFDILYKKLHSFTSPDILYDYFSDLARIPVRSKVTLGVDSCNTDRVSAFGLFIRNLVFSFSSADFAELSRLYEEIVSYRSSEMLKEHQTKRIAMANNHLRSFAHTIVSSSNNSCDIHTSSRCEEICKGILDISPDLPEAHFLEYSNSMKALEFSGSLDSLHRYFDYSVCSKQTLNAGDTDLSSNLDHINNHFATLCLAMLHLRFGNFKESIRCLMETIRVAVKRNDGPCVSQCLSILSRLQCSSSQNFHQFDILESCTMGRNSSPGSVSSNDAPSEVVSQSWVDLAKSFMCAITTCSDAVGISPVWACLHNAVDFGSSGNLKHVMGNSWQMKANIWHWLGSSALSSACDEVFYRLYSQHAEYSENAMSLCRLAEHQVSYRDFQDTLNVTILKGDDSLIHAMVNVMEFDKARKRESIRAAVDAASAVFESSPCEFGSSQLKVRASFMNALLKFQNNDVHPAYKDIISGVEESMKLGLHEEAGQMLLYLVKDTEIPEVAIPHITRCLTLSKNNKLGTTFCQASLALTNVHLQSGSPQIALRYLRSVLPQILGDCPPDTQYQAYMLMAKCFGCLAGNSNDRALEQALISLHSARNICKGSSEKHWVSRLVYVYYMQSLLYHRLGDIENRNTSAELYWKTKKLSSE